MYRTKLIISLVFLLCSLSAFPQNWLGESTEPKQSLDDYSLDRLNSSPSLPLPMNADGIYSLGEQEAYHSFSRRRSSEHVCDENCDDPCDKKGIGGVGVPLGDGLFVLLLLSALYAAYRWRRNFISLCERKEN